MIAVEFEGSSVTRQSPVVTNVKALAESATVTLVLQV